MTLEFFLSNYDLKEYVINKIHIKDNKLYLDITMPIHLDLIANGYRPELDMTQEKTFVFFVSHEDEFYSKDSKVEFNKEYVFINDEKIKITLSQVVIQ